MLRRAYVAAVRVAGRDDARALEYGSGANMAWLARRCRRVVSAEHDEPMIARDNIELRLAEPERSAAPRVPSERNDYAQCDFSSCVFDNSERARYADALARVTLPLERYRGWAPALPYRSETTLIGALPQESR